MRRSLKVLAAAAVVAVLSLGTTAPATAGPVVIMGNCCRPAL
ncbi:hypothetical protein [Cellulomonas sp. RIT-PI-Y]|jgi:hypothetical protein|nr:hypothetical protein [Cellulomonas sp. RIT-PI-Y]